MAHAKSRVKDSNQTINIKSTKLMVLTLKQVLEFPDSEWNNILAGKAINLNIVFSGMYSTATNNRAVKNIGDLELHFRASKPAKAIKTHGDWIVAWQIAVKATRFVFPHRTDELEYSDYITPYFASIEPHSHFKVINLDKAIRKKVGSVNNISLNELGNFCYLETCYLQGHGSGEDSAIPKAKSKAPAKAVEEKWRSEELCWLTHRASTCKYRHVCDNCGGSHRKSMCVQGRSGNA